MIIKKIFITDGMIRDDVIQALTDAETDELITIPSDALRDEFITDCIECTVMNYQDFDEYNPDYNDIVLDMAKLYGYRRI